MPCEIDPREPRGRNRSGVKGAWAEGLEDAAAEILEDARKPVQCREMDARERVALTH